jgi:hypothetical protein
MAVPCSQSAMQVSEADFMKLMKRAGMWGDSEISQ